MCDMQTSDLNPEFFREKLEQPLHTIFLTQYPNTFEEMARDLRSFGNSIEIVPFEYSGERTFGHLERIRFNGTDCIVKYTGPQSDDMFVVAATGVQQERDGLVLARGLATPLIAEIRVEDQIVAIFRQFAEGESLRDAVDAGKVSPSEARRQAQELVEKLTDSGLFLWDCNADNIWRRPDGAVVLLEGQCVVPSESEREVLQQKNTEHLNVMFPEPRS